MKIVLYYFTQKHKGNWEKIYNSLEKKEFVPKEKYLEINIEDISNYVCLIDKDYPNELKTIYKPPFSIFMYGNKELLNKKFLLGIYGNTNNKNYCDKLLKYKDVVFVLDFDNKKLINYFIKNNLNFILVYKNGFNKMNKELFKKVIESGNLILTEMPNTNKEVFNDQLHNRIIFGLTKKMLFFKSDTSFEFNTIIEFCRLEGVLCFSFFNLKNKNIKKIYSFNDIFLNCFLS